jgi:hypothetical protein
MESLLDGPPPRPTIVIAPSGRTTLRARSIVLCAPTKSNTASTPRRSFSARTVLTASSPARTASSAPSDFALSSFAGFDSTTITREAEIAFTI